MWKPKLKNTQKWEMLNFQLTKLSCGTKITKTDIKCIKEKKKTNKKTIKLTKAHH